MSKLIIFDCDGTLVDSEIISVRVFPAVWSTMGVVMTEDYFHSNFVGIGIDSDLVKEVLARLPADGMEIAEKKYKEELAKNLQAIAGIRDLLQDLKCHMCVASNSPLNHVNRALHSTDLKKHFEERIYSATLLPQPKPSPDVFLHAAQELGFKPQDCLVIEDSASGIKAAQSAGMKVVGFMGGLHFNEGAKKRLLEKNADYYCHTTTELAEVIKKFLS